MLEQSRFSRRPTLSSWREPIWTGCKLQPLGLWGVSQEGLDKREHQLLVTQVESDPEVQLFHHPGPIQHGLVIVIEEKVQHLRLARLRALVLTKQREKVQALLERHVHHLLESGE